jgi:5-formyltetrahydrofolate cyclo-ligase
MTHHLGTGNNSPESPPEIASDRAQVGLIAADKVAQRRNLIATRRAIDSKTKAHWDALIATQIMTWRQTQAVQSMAVYWPIQGEPDLRALYQELSNRGVRLALPVVVNKDAPLQFAAWAPGDALVRDAMGVFCPAAKDVCITPEAILIPCVGFNAARFRLGYGGGFYDRTLAQLPHATAIGIAYTCLATQFDHAPHDIALDRIITEKPN